MRIKTALFAVLFLFRLNGSGFFVCFYEAICFAVSCCCMKNKYHYLYIFFFLLFIGTSHSVNGEDRVSVSLITCSPGEEVYSLFGHTALRYCNPDKNIDVVYNYGVFDFREPCFVIKFILGETDYLLGVIDFPLFIQEYAMRGSGVTEQKLNLDSRQKKKLFALLRNNCRPENRVYRYNYFYNNCTTKARDVLEESLSDADGIKYDFVEEQLTFRDVLHRFTAVSPWSAFGIDLLLGAEADEFPGNRVLQFIPSSLMSDFSKAEISDSLGQNVPLVIETKELLPIAEREISSSFLSPNLLFVILFLSVSVLMFVEYKKNRLFYLIDILLMSLQGIAGLLVLFMVLFSVHPTVGSNWLVWLLNPVPLFVLFAYLFSVTKHHRTFVMWIQILMVGSFLVASPFLPQYFPFPVYIYAFTLFIRSLFIMFSIKI